ncbi:MAG: tetratricopeptide repeat protein [Chitinophagales bacterium]
MAEVEKVKRLIEELKSCPATEISKYFAPAMDLIRFLNKAEKIECAQSFYEWAKENAERDPLKFPYSEFLLAQVHFMQEEHEEALQLVSSARKNFEKLNDQVGMGLCAMLIGGTYRTLGNFELALKMLWEGFELLRQSGKYPIFLAANANSIANIDLEMHNYDEALSMFNIAHDESKKTGDYYFNIYALHGLGKVNMLQHKYPEAKEYFEKALQLAEENKSALHTANSMTELANFYFRTDNFPESEKLNIQALAIREENHFNTGAVTNLIHLGEIYIKQSKWDEALRVLEKGLAVAEQTKVKPKIYQVHSLLSEIYRNKNDFEKSLFHYELFHKLREQVEQEDYARKLADAKLIFQAEQTKKENIIIKKQKEEIQKKNIELQETIDELTITKVSRKAKAVTLVIAIVLFILQDFILGSVLNMLPSDNYFLSLGVKMGIIFSLSPINGAIEHYLLKKVIKNKKQNKEFVSLETGIPSN